MLLDTKEAIRIIKAATKGRKGAKKITPYRLAIVSGVSQSTISRIIRGRTTEPSYTVLTKILWAIEALN